MASSSLSSFFFIFLLLTPHLTSSRKKPPDTIDQDRDALDYFMKSVQQNAKINWNKETNKCSRDGVICDPTNNIVFLRLPAKGLKGKIPSGSLGKITTLQVLSLNTNLLSGPLPADFANLRELRSVFLFNNSFSGQFPLSVITNWKKLRQLDISYNKFTGGIPMKINNLKKLERLKLDNNKFNGWLPEYLPSSIYSDVMNFSVTNNSLSGPIPPSLADKFQNDSFQGNAELCGKPLPPCKEPFTPPPAAAPSPGPSESVESPPKKPKKLSTGAIVAIAVGSSLMMILILLSCLRKKRNRPVKKEKTGAFMESEGNKLVSFEGGVYSFGLEELLRASTELLGKGSVGKTYKTVLKEGNTVVVKRLKDVDVSEEEFKGVMEKLGKMKNENVVPIRAYYYSKNEKLLVCDYYPAGSLFALLHGSRGSGWTPLDWNHRFGIALSAAKGVACLHVAEVVHGNIKSSNILLRQDSNKDADVSDFGLNKLFGGSSTPNTRVTGYRAPEVLDTREVTFKSDVYSFGVLLIELLSGKAPNYASLGEKGTDLPSWVKSVKGEEGTVREKWITEVFDAQLMMYQNIEEMVQLLEIAMECVSIVPDKRPAMQKVVCMMEDMNRAATNDEMRQSSDDPSKGSDGHKPPMESRNSPNTVTP